MGFLKNIWTVMYTFINLYGVDQEIAMCNQMSLLLNELSQEKNTQLQRYTTNNLCQGESFTLKRVNNSNDIIRDTVKEKNWIRLALQFSGHLKGLGLYGDILWPVSYSIMCFISAKAQNIHFGSSLSLFRPRSQRFAEKKRLFFGCSTGYITRWLTG